MPMSPCAYGRARYMRCVWVTMYMDAYMDAYTRTFTHGTHVGTCATGGLEPERETRGTQKYRGIVLDDDVLLHRRFSSLSRLRAMAWPACVRVRAPRMQSADRKRKEPNTRVGRC